MEKNVQFAYLARAPWYFGALFLFFALFHATPHTLATWEAQAGNSKCWLNLLYLLAPRAGGCERTREISACIFERWDGLVGCRSELRGGSEELVARGVAGGVGGGSWLKNSAVLGAKHIFITCGARRDVGTA